MSVICDNVRIKRKEINMAYTARDAIKPSYLAVRRKEQIRGIIIA